MSTLKRFILLLPGVPILLWILFGFLYLSNSGDSAILFGMVAIFASIVIAIIEIILIMLYIRTEGSVTNEITNKADRTILLLGFGDKMLIFFTCLYLFAYYFAIDHSLIDMILVTVSLFSLLCATYFLKRSERVKVILFMGVNITSTILLLVYVLLKFDEIYGSVDGPFIVFSIFGLVIFAGFILDFYCVSRLAHYLNKITN